MATITDLKKWVEASDFISRLQEDTSKIEDKDFSTVQEGYNDLTLSLAKDPEFQDLYLDPNSTAKAMISKMTDDSQAFLKSVTLSVAGAYGGGDWNLSNGSSAATEWDALQNATFSVSWSVYSSSSSKRPDFTADWSSITQHLDEDDYQAGIHGSWTDTSYYTAKGSASQWAPFIHCNGGDHSALDHDCYMG